MVHDSFLFANILLFLCLWIIGLILFYFIIKVAVRNGVREANRRMSDSIQQIEKSVIELNMRITKKESD